MGGGLPGFQEAGLVFDGVEAFHQRSGPAYGEKERRGKGNAVLKNGNNGGQTYQGFRMLAWPLVEEGLLPEFWARIWCQGLGLNWEDTRRVGNILPNVQGAGLDSVEWKISTRDVGLVFRELVWNLMGWKACARGTGHDIVSSFLLNEKRLLGLFSILFPPIR